MLAKKDLFLSYRWADRLQVEPLLNALRLRGISVWQDAREVSDFSSIQQSVIAGLSGARAILAWYSARYNESRACQWELTMAYCAAQAEGDPRKRILVVNPELTNEHVILPQLFDQLHLITHGAPVDEVVAHALADRIQTALHTVVPPTPLGRIATLTPPRWLPSIGLGSLRFVGRLQQMWALHGELSSTDSAMLTGIGGKPGVVVVCGSGGVGKSLLVEEYALRFGAAYPGGVFWLRAFGHPDTGTIKTPDERENSRDAQLLNLALGLGLDVSGLGPVRIRTEMAAYFELHARCFLWVVDDLPSDLGSVKLSDWMAPHPMGRTVFTTRTRRHTHIPTIDVPQLGSAEARGLLTRNRDLDVEESHLADSICDGLGYHALAVDVTAALVGRRGLAATLNSLCSESRDVLDLAGQFEEVLPNGYQRSISAMFLASINQLDDLTRELLRLIAALAAAPIPRALLVHSLVAATRLDQCLAQDRVDVAIDSLLSSSLADEAGDGAITVHTLVRRTIRFADRFHVGFFVWTAVAMHVISREMTKLSKRLPLSQLEPWVVHARELSSTANSKASIDLLGWVARYDYERGAYGLAQRSLERLIEAKSRVFGPEHIDTLESMNGLATVLKCQGNYSSARQLFENVLELRKRLLGVEHRSTLVSVSGLAIVLGDQGDYQGARQLQEYLLQTRRRLQGNEHEDTLIATLNLASTLASQGDLHGARRLEETALEISKRIFGEEHPSCLTSMNNLATTLCRLGDHQGAKRIYENNLAICRRALGDLHPTTLKSMHNLAGILLIIGEIEVARRLQEDCVAGLSKTLGPAHPITSNAELVLKLMIEANRPSVPIESTWWIRATKWLPRYKRTKVKS